MPDWLQDYATNSHQWREYQAVGHGGSIFYRPLGLVESLFDSDGMCHEGRADINMAANFEIKTNMSKEALRRHILLAWANLQLRHTLLMAAADSFQDYMDDTTPTKQGRFFIIHQPSSGEEALRRAQDHLVFLEDHYASVDTDELYYHAQNTARTFDAQKNLSRALVHPLTRSGPETWSLSFLFIMSHQISDGLTCGAWTLDLLRILNQPTHALQAAIAPLASTLAKRLPVPQEDLYPPTTGSRARRRWFWAITIVLRHVQKPYPLAFQNPLRRVNPRPPTLPDTRPFDQVLDYSRPPALNCGRIRAILGSRATRRLHRACRQAGCSLGAGSFVLVAIVMMEMYERRMAAQPDGEEHGLPFIGSFPVNPRPFFSHGAAPDSVMLAFSDGVVLPFLPSSLDLDGRIRLLARSAQRQLSRYQKRGARTSAAVPSRRGEMVEYMGARGAGRVIATTYLDTLERAHDRVPGYQSRSLGYAESLPKRGNLSLGTCGVSSVGRINSEMAAGKYDLTRPLEGEGELVADFRESRMNVRAREGEFLVGMWGDDDHIVAGVSYDACAIDPDMAELWRERMETLLEDGDAASRL